MGIKADSAGTDPGSFLQTSAGATRNRASSGLTQRCPGVGGAGSAVGDAPWASLQAPATAKIPVRRPGARKGRGRPAARAKQGAQPPLGAALGQETVPFASAFAVAVGSRSRTGALAGKPTEIVRLGGGFVGLSWGGFFEQIRWWRKEWRKGKSSDAQR